MTTCTVWYCTDLSNKNILLWFLRFCRRTSDDRFRSKHVAFENNRRSSLYLCEWWQSERDGPQQQQVTALQTVTTVQTFTQNVRSSSHLLCFWLAFCDATARRVAAVSTDRSVRVSGYTASRYKGLTAVTPFNVTCIYWIWRRFQSAWTCSTTVRAINREASEGTVRQFLVGGICRRKSTSESRVCEVGSGLTDEPTAARRQ